MMWLSLFKIWDLHITSWLIWDTYFLICCKYFFLLFLEWEIWRVHTFYNNFHQVKLAWESGVQDNICHETPSCYEMRIILAHEHLMTYFQGQGYSLVPLLTMIIAIKNSNTRRQAREDKYFEMNRKEDG